MEQTRHTRWPASDINRWYKRQPLWVGANFTPSTASNQLEMWQAATFDPARIELELGWAERLGMNTMRVFLHDLAYEQDPAGFKSRVDRFLTIAARHHIKPMLVLFDSCWDPHPEIGPQRAPAPGVHNSCWVQSPHIDALMDETQHGRLETYVKDILTTFSKDTRILAWDVYNEPDNVNHHTYNDPKQKWKYVEMLLEKTFAWAREVGPSQPLTSGIWNGDWQEHGHLNKVEQMQVDHADFITFHSYLPPEGFARQVAQLKRYQRPVVCTEYLARENGSTVQGILGVAEKHQVGTFCWGFVDGKTQTRCPWQSWGDHVSMGQLAAAPENGASTATGERLWFHDLLHADGTAYQPAETHCIKRLTAHQPGWPDQPKATPSWAGQWSSKIAPQAIVPATAADTNWRSSELHHRAPRHR